MILIQNAKDVHQILTTFSYRMDKLFADMSELAFAAKSGNHETMKLLLEHYNQSDLQKAIQSQDQEGNKFSMYLWITKNNLDMKRICY